MTESRVAKNTLLLYFRMLLTMCISIYTSRVILQSLGVEDYGIYNVVGGVVALLNFFTNALASSFQRFFCIEINKNDNRSFSNVIGTSLSVIALWAIIVIIIAETFGLWLVNYKLVIPIAKMWTANVVYQLSIASFIVCLFQSVYNAMIISFERMKLFAYISIFEAICKLCVAFTITLFFNNYLFNYALLMFISHIVIFVIYMLYSMHSFRVCRIGFRYNTAVLKKLFSFSSWTLIGTFSNVIQTNGVSILLNIFFGPAINAARAISFQIYTAVGTFTRGFQTAFSSTMIKTYNNNQQETATRQLLTSSKVSLYLMFLLSLPFFINIDLILNLWLGKEHVPTYTNQFVRLVMIIGIIESLSPPIVNIIYANGNIRNFQIAIGMFTILIIPLSYLGLRMGCSPLSVYIITIMVTSIAYIIRLYYLKKCLINIKLTIYCRKLAIPTICSILILYVVGYILPSMLKENIIHYIMTVICAELVSIAAIYNIGIDDHEKKIIKGLIRCVRH